LPNPNLQKYFSICGHMK